jgi:hypothetical protein
MKNKVVIGVIAVIIIGAGVWYFISQSGKGGAPIVSAPVANSNGTSLDTLAAILASGRPVKCTVVPTADNGNMSGTFYIANGKTRGDYSVTEGAQPMSGHMIVIGQTSYTWFEGQSTGFKITATSANANVNAPVAANQGLDPNQKIGYNCSPWSADATLFALPANVKFNDMSALAAPAVTPPAGGSAGTGNVPAVGNSSQCATCDGLPDAYKAQCKSALGCK